MLPKVIVPVKTDRKTRDQARKVAQKLGVSLSGLLNAYLLQLIRYQQVRLSLKTENGFIPQFKAGLLAVDQEARTEIASGKAK